MEANLELAIKIATEAHEGQTRFDGSPYIGHPLRVMQTLAIRGYSESTQIVGVLHDVPEDTEVSISDISGFGFGEEITFPLELLTKQSGDDYTLYVHRLSANSRARAVKKADLFDNMNLDGLQNPSKRRIINIEKYGAAMMYLARFPQPKV